MAVVVAAVAKLVAAITVKSIVTAVVKFVVTTALSIGVSKLIAKRATAGTDGTAGGDGGGRVQLPPATDNKIPIVYGSAFIGGSIIDAMLSTDQKTMWYVVALAEHSDDQGGGGGSYSFGNVYYDGKLVNYGTNGAVTGLTTNTTPAQTDTRCNGYLYIYLFSNGSSSGTNTGGQTAAQILSTTNGVPAGQAWGANQTMDNCAFAIVKVIYSTDAGTTGVGALTVQMTNSITKPGTAILDYMLNDRYGCNIPIDRIDTASLTDLNTYSDQLINYKPVGWVSGDPYSTQARYRINGPLDTSQNCLNNLQYLVDSCDSWLQYSELTGLWRVILNKPYNVAPNSQTLNQLFLINSSNLVGGIEVSPIDLNETYNQIEVAYPNTNVKDQTDYQIIDLFQTNTALLSPNEAVNRLNVTLPLVNNAVQAKYLAARRIYQSREDLVITLALDYTGITIEAGDVIRVTHEVYGWTDKLFRVSTVSEEKYTDGSLGVRLQAFEYNSTVYADDPVQDYVPAFNTGLKDPNVIDQPGTPTVGINPVNPDGTQSFKITSTVPANGLVLYMDYNYGDTSNVQQHRLYRTVQQSNGDPFTNSISSNIDINDLPIGNYYFSTTARNDNSGRRSNTSAIFNWSGATIPNPNVIQICNVSSNGNIFTYSPAATITANSFVYTLSGSGVLPANTQVAQVISNTQFTTTLNPIVALSNSCITVVAGGITSNVIGPNVVTYYNIANSALPQSLILEAGGGVNQNGNVVSPANIKSNSYSFYNPGPFYLSSSSTYNANYVYPFYQGTSKIANGYLANSTSSFNPADASILISPPTSDGWYRVIALPLYASNNWPLTNSETLELEIGAAFTANQDSLVQVLPYYEYGGNLLGYQIADAQFISTITVPANISTTINFKVGYSEYVGANLQEGYNVTGWYVRNLSKSNLICEYNFTSAYRRKSL